MSLDYDVEQPAPKTPYRVTFQRMEIQALDGPDAGKRWYVTAGMIKNRSIQRKRRKKVARGARKRKLR